MLQTLLGVYPIVNRVTESGVKGHDFDAEIVIQRAHLPVEFKAKADATPFTESTVVSTVKAAARQFPKGSAGLVILRVPFAWVGPRLEEIYPDALAEATRQTSRVAAVISAIDKAHLAAGQRRGSVSRHWDCFMAAGAPPAAAEQCLEIFRFLESDLRPLAALATF